MKKKILILFPDMHLSYSPTVIGLYDLLTEYFDVTIVAPSPQKFDNQPLSNRQILYLKEIASPNQRRFYRRLFPFLASFFPDFSILQKNKVELETFYEYFQIKKHLKKISPDIVIAVDFKTLWYVELLGKKAEFLSLEIDDENIFYQRCSKTNIKSVVIQTADRYNYLFKTKKLKTFFIQNAPIFKPFPNQSKRVGLVYCGTAWNRFGFYHCLDFIKEFPDYSLTVRGAILNDDRQQVGAEYDGLLTQKRLTIADNYLDDSEVVNFLKQFRIGFCFYNFAVDLINNFNYHSAPSGKMFKYFAAGVPVIAQDISGMQPIKEFDCGVLIKDLEPQTIKKAVDTIEANFEYYSANCLNAAAHYSFDKSAQPFLDYLLK